MMSSTAEIDTTLKEIGLTTKSNEAATSTPTGKKGLILKVLYFQFHFIHFVQRRKFYIYFK